MRQISSSDQADVASVDGQEGSRALVRAREVRIRAVRNKRRRRWLFAIIIVGSTLGALGWGAFIDKPRYEADTRFTVRGDSPEQSQSGAATSLISSGTGGSPGVGFVDGFAVNDFLKSRECMTELAKRLPLAKLLGVDPKAGAEALYQAYTNHVLIKFFMVEQENYAEVDGYSPQQSKLILSNLLSLAQQFVARMDDQGVQNELDVDARQVRSAEDQSVKAANAVAAWRAANRNVDPEAEATMDMNMIGQIQTELNTARINYAKVLAFGNPNHPMLQPAKLQVQALERQLADARANLAGGHNSQAARLQSYWQLKNAQTFADSNLTAARDAYQQSFLEATRLRRYLSVISQPIATDVPSSPNFWLLALEGLLAGLTLAFLTSLALSLIG